MRDLPACANMENQAHESASTHPRAKSLRAQNMCDVLISTRVCMFVCVRLCVRVGEQEPLVLLLRRNS